MASETPKKVMDEISKCFLCSSPSTAQERVFIFGNSTHNFVEIIRSSLDFDISCYADSKLFICKAVCYKWLLKFERATDKVLELKREILEFFQGRPRAKRLFNAGDERREQSIVLCYKEKIELDIWLLQNYQMLSSNSYHKNTCRRIFSNKDFLLRLEIEILRGHRFAWFPLLAACRFVEFDTSIICHVLVYCFGSFLFQEFAFEGQNMTFTVKVLFTCIIYCHAGPGYD